MAIFRTDGAVDLYYDNSKKFETTSAGTTTTGKAYVAGGTTGRCIDSLNTHTSGGELASFQNEATDHYGGLVVSGGEIDRECRLEAAWGSGFMTFWCDNAERMRIAASGSLLFNTTSTTIDSSNRGFVLNKEANNGVYLEHCREANGTHSTAEFHGNQGKMQVMGDGDLQNTNNNYGAISDVTLKQDIVDASSQWDDIKAIRVRKFRYKDNPTGDLQIGVVAQELETVSPKLVKEVATSSKDLTSTETVKAVKYSVLYMKAVKALQEAQARIEALETKVATLEGA